MGFKFNSKGANSYQSFTPSDAYGHKDTNALIKNDETAKAIFDATMELVKPLATNVVLKANDGKPFEATKKENGVDKPYTPKMVVNVKQRMVDIINPKTNQPLVQTINGKKVNAQTAMTVDDLEGDKKKNLGNLYSVSATYSISQQQMTIYASTNVKEENGKPKVEVAFVTPIISKYSDNKADCKRVKGVDEIKEEIAKGNQSWIAPAMQKVANAIIDSGFVANRIPQELKDDKERIKAVLDNGTKIEIPMRERDAEGKVVMTTNAEGKSVPKLVEGKTEQAPLCYANIDAQHGNPTLQIGIREGEDKSIKIEKQTYKDNAGQDKAVWKATDWSLTYQRDENGEYRKDVNQYPPVPREVGSKDMPLQFRFDTAGGIVGLVPPISELHQVLVTELNVDKAEYDKAFTEVYGNAPNGKNGFGVDGYGTEVKEVEQIGVPTNEQNEQIINEQEQAVNIDDFEEIEMLNDGDIPF